MAVGAEGVHIGQDDMGIHYCSPRVTTHCSSISDLASTRQMLGPEAIIGVTCNNISEAEFAASGGANYLGIGAVFATSTYLILTSRYYRSADRVPEKQTRKA